MKLVPNTRQSWRWFSVQIMALVAVLPLVWAELPADLKSYIPPDWRPFLVTGLALAAIIGRMVDQGGRE